MTGRACPPQSFLTMSAFEEYYDEYGPHFNKKLYEWAVSMMSDRNGRRVTAKTKEEVKSFLQANGVMVDRDKGHDAAYVHAMLMADCWGSSYTTDKQLALGVKDFLDDPDGSDTKAFDHFVVDCRSKGEPIFWDEMM